MIGSSKSVWGFDPRTIPGCQLWLDAADSSTITLNGSTVSSWRDKSSNGYTVSQSTASNQPTYTSNLLNGLPGIQLSSTRFLYQIGSNMPNFTSSSSTTVFIVAKNGSSYTSFGWNLISSIWFNNVATSRYQFSFGNGQINSVTLYPNSGSSVSLNSNAIVGFTISPSGNSINVNGTLTTFAGSTAPSANNTTWFQIGDSRGASASEFYVSDQNIYEFIGFDTTLTTTQRQTIEGYLAHKWGLVGSLPSTHPFYYIRPHLRTFQPIDVPGCQLWLDAADLSSLVLSGSSVTTWNDKSGNGYHMNTLPASAGWSGTAAYPTIGTSINGLQTVNFLAQSGLKQSTTLDGVKNLFWVGRIAAPDGTAAGGNSCYFLLGHDTLYDWHSAIYRGGFVDVNAQGGISYAIANLFTSDPTAVTNTTFLNVIMPSPPSISLLSVTGITGTTRYQGICYDRSIHTGWCGDLAEVLIYSTALTTSQRQQVEGYLAHKWGLTPTIQSTHPFSKFPPASIPSPPAAIASVTLTSLYTSSGTINWTSTNATGYRWYVGTGAGSGQVASGIVTSGSTLTTTVTYTFVSGTLYYAWVIPYNLDGLGPTTISASIITASATGGTIVSSGGFTYHVFTSSGSLVVTGVISMNYLVVGGGGGGGDRHGGGGGGGGVLSGTWSTSTTTYTVTVGAGGIHGATSEDGQIPYGSPGGAGSKGGDSAVSGTGISVTAYGGGGGGTYDGNPTGTVGSGGGGGGNNLSGVSGTAGQGNAGGAGLIPGAGGGGGAGGAGVAANTGTGGIGTSSFSTHLLAVGYGTTFAVPTSPNIVISGGVAYIAGGGGGCAGTSPGPGGNGGLGGGGRGDWTDSFISAGTPNTGGGGGGTRSDLGLLYSIGRDGGSGLVLVWY
jgi:hypothetical protein